MKSELMSIGEIAKRCGLSVDSIRHYERKGVIQNVERTGSGYRRYPAATVERVLAVRRALEIGFTLDELSRIYKRRISGDPPCRAVRDLAVRKLSDVERQLEALQIVRTELMQLIASWDERLQATSRGELAHLLDSMNDKEKINETHILTRPDTLSRGFRNGIRRRKASVSDARKTPEGKSASRTRR